MVSVTPRVMQERVEAWLRDRMPMMVWHRTDTREIAAARFVLRHRVMDQSIKVLDTALKQGQIDGIVFALRVHDLGRKLFPDDYVCDN